MRRIKRLNDGSKELLKKIKEKCIYLINVLKDSSPKLTKVLRGILALVSVGISAQGGAQLAMNASLLFRYRKYLKDELIAIQTGENEYEVLSRTGLVRNVVHAGVKILIGLLGAYLSAHGMQARKDSACFRKDGLKEKLVTKIDQILLSIKSFANNIKNMPVQKKVALVRALLLTLRSIIAAGLNAKAVYEALRCTGKLRKAMMAVTMLLSSSGVPLQNAANIAALMRIWQGIVGSVWTVTSVFTATRTAKNAVNILKKEGLRRRQRKADSFRLKKVLLKS